MAKGKNNGKKNKNANLKAAYQTKREIWGVVIIALGLFLGASLYSDAVGIFGRAISGFVFGMFGIAGYAAIPHMPKTNPLQALPPMSSASEYQL